MLLGDVTTLAGGSSGLKDGEGREAKFLHPTGISLDLYSGTLYVADHVSKWTFGDFVVVMYESYKFRYDN